MYRERCATCRLLCGSAAAPPHPEHRRKAQRTRHLSYTVFSTNVKLAVSNLVSNHSLRKFKSQEMCKQNCNNDGSIISLALAFSASAFRTLAFSALAFSSLAIRAYAFSAVASGYQDGSRQVAVGRPP